MSRKMGMAWIGSMDQLSHGKVVMDEWMDVERIVDTMSRIDKMSRGVCAQIRLLQKSACSGSLVLSMSGPRGLHTSMTLSRVIGRPAITDRM